MMKNVKVYLFVLLFLPLLSGCLTDDEKTGPDVIAGLKEALTVGSTNSVLQLNKENGYFNNPLNPALKILLPPEAVSAEAAIRNLGLGSQVDNFILQMNRAAEDAASEAKPIFVDAVKGITIDDGMTILKGADTAATTYLKTKTYTGLQGVYQPKVKASMDKVGAQDLWETISTNYNSYATLIGEKPLPTDISAYVTDKGLTGLFKVVGQEEKKIRKDPVARVSQLLKDVFALQD